MSVTPGEVGSAQNADEAARERKLLEAQSSTNSQRHVSCTHHIEKLLQTVLAPISMKQQRETGWHEPT